MTEEKNAAIQVGKRIPGGQGLSAVLLRRASEVELDWDVRQKSRIEAIDSLGRAKRPIRGAVRGEPRT